MNRTHHITIRKAKKIDLKSVYLLEREYIIEHEMNQLKQWDLAETRIKECLTDSIDRMFVATYDKEVIGHVYWSIYKNKPCVFSIYVKTKYRKKRIGTELIKNVEKNIIDKGYSKVALSTLISNPAQYVFLKMNYNEVSREDGWINYLKKFDDIPMDEYHI